MLYEKKLITLDEIRFLMLGNFGLSVISLIILIF